MTPFLKEKDLKLLGLLSALTSNKVCAKPATRKGEHSPTYTGLWSGSTRKGVQW